MTRAELIQYITDNVYPNARNEVTAPMVRDSLLEIVDFLGDAATYNIGMVASGNQGLVTGGNVNTAIALALLPYYTAVETGQAIDDAIARIGLGQAAYKNIGQVAENNTDLVTGGQVYTAINTALTSAIKFQGISDTPLTDGSTTNPIQINGQSYTAKKGDMVVYGGNEFLWVGNKWQQMGDESSYALKTVQIVGTGYLTGGGDLTMSRTLDISATAKGYIDHGEAAYNYFPGGVLDSTHLPSMYIGTTSVQFSAAAQNLTGISSVRATSNVLTLFEWDVTNSAWHFHGNIYTDGWFSGGGISPGGGGGGGGIDPAAMWRLLTNDPSLTQYDNYTKISADHIVFPVTSVVGLGGAITAQQIAQGLNLGSYAYKNSLLVSDIPDLSGTYLPKTGGTLARDAREILVLNQTTTSTGQQGPYLRFSLNGDAKAGVGYNSEIGTFLEIFDTPSTTKYINVKSDGLYWQNQYLFLNSNNYATYVTNTTDGRYIPEPTSGQTTTTSFRTFNTDSETGIAFKRGTVERLYVGTYSDNAYLCVRDTTGNDVKYHRFYYDKVVLDCNLSVGAGNNPAYRLDVNSGNTSIYAMRLNSTLNEVSALFALNGTNKAAVGAYSNGVSMYNFTSGNSVHLNDSGYFVTPSRLSVGAGENPAYMLDVNGEMRTNGGIFGKGWTISGRSTLLLNSDANSPADITFRSGSYTTGTWGDWSLSSRGNEGSNNSFCIGRGAYNAGNPNESVIFVINPDGNVIIGQSVFGATTTNQLDVRGVIYASTGIYTDGWFSGGGVASSSDRRLKKNIKNFAYTPKLLLAIRPREWDWKDGSAMVGHAAGFVAQEIEPIMPYAVDGTRNFKALFYDRFHALEIAGLQDHERRIVELERAVKERDEKIEKLEKMLKLN